VQGVFANALYLVFARKKGPFGGGLNEQMIWKCAFDSTFPSSVLNAPDFIMAIINVAFVLFLFARMTSSGLLCFVAIKGHTSGGNILFDMSLVNSGIIVVFMLYVQHFIADHYGIYSPEIDLIFYTCFG
jgi:hypothetical protein